MKTVLVIGAAGGVGTEVCRKLLSGGHKVVGTVMDDEQAARLKADLPDIAAIEKLGLGDVENIGPALTSIIAGLDRLDQVAVCAAISPAGPVETTSLAVCRQTLDINVLASVAIFQAVIGRLRETKGRLLFVSSMAGKLTLPFTGIYTASKHALEGIADAMRQEVAPDGVDIILVEPGGIRTPLVSHQIETARKELDGLSSEVRARYGHLYEGFIAAASASYENGGSTPDQVAAVVLEGLDAEAPEARYIAGDDARQLIEARAKLTDREFDAMLSQMFQPG